LLDDYAHARLDTADAAAVEQHLLGSEENRRSVRIARALREQGATVQLGATAQPGATVVPRATGTPRVTELSSAAPPQPARAATASRRRPAQVAWVAGLLAACVIAIAVIPRWRLAPGSAASLSPSSPVSHTAQTSGLSAASALRIVSLLADVNRGAARPSIMVAAGSDLVRLQAEVTEATPDSRYSLYIEDAAGRRLFDASALAVQTAGPYRFIEAVVPAAALAPGERTVVLTKSGAAAGSTSSFRWQLTGVVDSAAEK